jgi:hypothetical protein
MGGLGGTLNQHRMGSQSSEDQSSKEGIDWLGPSGFDWASSVGGRDVFGQGSPSPLYPSVSIAHRKRRDVA